MKSGFKVMGIATSIKHEKRIWIIRHLISKGVTDKGLMAMNATKEEIKEAKS